MFLSAALLAQDVGTGPAAAGAAGDAAGAAGCGGAAGGMNAIMLVAMVAVMYFLVLRPQQQQQKTHEAFLKGIKVGDKVRTDSGILGEIAEIQERDVIILIAAGVKMNVLKSKLAGIEVAAAEKTANS